MARRTVTRNDNGKATQLSLFDDAVEEKQQAPEQLAEEETVIDPYGNTLPAVIFQRSGGYANGDTSPEALECLAECLLHDITVCYYGPPIVLEPKDEWKRVFGCYFPGRERYWYRCVASGIVDGKVVGAYVYEKCLMDRDIRSKYGDDEEEA